MDKEIFIREFLERIEKCAELDGENARAVKKCWVWFRRDEARAALDRLFKDLQDFAGVIITNGTSGGVIGFSKGSVLREVIADKIEKQKTKRKIK